LQVHIHTAGGALFNQRNHGGPRGWNARLFTRVPVHDMTAGFVGHRTEVLHKVDLDRYCN